MDVMLFERYLEDNIFDLYSDLRSKTYIHGRYTHFTVIDSKKRSIDKAGVRDRIVHQIIFDYLKDKFEPVFINDSYSSRDGKGSYKAIQAFVCFTKLEEPKNKNVYVLKCDVKKYFESINHEILFNLIKKKIRNKNILRIIKEIIDSFNIGIPLGNITSQIFSNIYLNNFDHFVKKRLRIRFYVRYNDDFVLISRNKNRLEFCLKEIKKFTSKLFLEIPESKVSIRKLKWGVDFLGFVIFPNCVLLRNKTKQKVFQRINENNFQSYFALLEHCNSYKLREKLIWRLNSFSGYL